MTITELIAQLEAVRAEHGDGVKVAARRFGDYLEGEPKVFAERKVRYAGSNCEQWVEPEPDWAEPAKPPIEDAMVVFIEHDS